MRNTVRYRHNKKKKNINGNTFFFPAAITITKNFVLHNKKRINHSKMLMWWFGTQETYPCSPLFTPILAYLPFTSEKSLESIWVRQVFTHRLFGPFTWLSIHSFCQSPFTYCFFSSLQSFLCALLSGVSQFCILYFFCLYLDIILVQYTVQR